MKNQKNLEEKFFTFHKKRPEIYQELVKFSKEWRNRKGTSAKLGIGMVWERLRWELQMGGNDTPRLSNNHRAFYARLIMDNEPELQGIFILRQQQDQASIGPSNSKLQANIYSNLRKVT